MSVKQLDEEALFHASRRIPAGEARDLFVAQASAGDAGLADRVRVLLTMHEQEPQSAGPEPPTSDYEPISEPPGTRIGPYKLLQQLGEGGMGTVWMAEQEQPVRRRVALKIIKPGMDSAQVIARFEAERQALAMMDHVNIAKVLDAGTTPTGRPYFVMELIRGESIIKFCDDQHLTLRERLELFVPVCQAVQHAHQKGVIHRDLKPSNVLVTLYDGRPVPKVIDFGVAKAIQQRLTERTMFTEFGAVVGTYEYMAPEQAALSHLDVDTRSDVYSLGVLLYELLTGTTPLERQRLRSAAFDEVLRLIREEEPPKPSTRLSGSGDRLPSIAAARRTEPAKLSRLMRGELDWIVMKALEKDRARRYETANGLARDLQHYLADEPVEACPPSAGYRMRKFACKHRAAFATAGAFVTVLLAAAVVSSWLAVWAMRAEQRERAVAAEMQRERDRAVEAEKDATAQGNRAKGAEAATRQEADKVRTINQFLMEDLLTQADPEHNAPANRMTLLEVVDRAAEKVGERFRDQPLLEASLRGTLGDVYHGLGEYAKADHHWSAALALRRRELGADHADTYRAQTKVGHMLVHSRRLDDSYALLRAAADGLARVLGADHPDTLTANAELADTLRALGRHAESLPLWEYTYERRMAILGATDTKTLMSLKCLADGYEAAGQPDKALPLAEQALERAKAALGPDHLDTVLSMGTLASVYKAVGQLDKAQPLAGQALEKIRARFGPDHTRTLRAMNSLANVYKAQNRFDKAEELIQQALDVSIHHHGEDHALTLDARRSLGHLRWLQNRYDEARDLYSRCYEISRRTLGEEDRSALQDLQNIAAQYRDQGKWAEAEPLLARVLAGRRKVLGATHPQTLATMKNLIPVYRALEKADEAEPLFCEILAVQRAKRPKNDHDLAAALVNLGLVRLNLRRTEDAVPLLDEALVLVGTMSGQHDAKTLDLVADLARAYQSAGQIDKAIPLFQDALERRKVKPGPEHVDTLAAMHALAVAYRLGGRTQESQSLFEQTLKLRRDRLGPDHADTLSTMNSLAVAYWTAKRLDKSIPLFEETLRRKRTKLGDDKPATVQTARNLALNYRDAKRLDEAKAVYEEWLARSREKLGPDHRQTHAVLSDLAETYEQAKEFDRALPLYHELLDSQSRKLAKDDIERAATLASLGQCLLNVDQPGEAEPVLRYCLDIRDKKMPDDWRRFNAQSLLGGSLLAQKKYDDAEPLLRQGYDGMKLREAKIPASRKVRLIEALDRLVQLYEAWGQPAEAAKWRKELEAVKAAAAPPPKP
jgi:serine/threonine protein kinase/tetratricopeptide (TPR) repeat protein